MRMNGFEQIKAFYSWVFNNPDKVRPTHISLYLFLWNQANRANWVEWFKCPYDLAMQGACIGNKGTYYKCLDELQNYNLIKYKKGLNNYKAPQISLIKLYDASTNTEPLTEQVTVPLSEHLTVPLTEPLTEPLTVLLSGNIYKLITNNYKLVTDNIERWINEAKKDKSKSEVNSKPSVKKNFTPPTQEEVILYFEENGYSKSSAEKAFNYYNAGNWKDSSGKQVLSWKQKMRGVWFKDENKKQTTERKMVY